MDRKKQNKRGTIFVFSAPSGAGKTTILDHLKATIDGLVYSISATTRRPRPGEIDGIHYFFSSEDEFTRQIEMNNFAEWEIVHGNYYGTPKSFIEKTIVSGKHIIMDIDVYGKKKLDKVYPEAVGVLVLPPTMEELERRLRARKSDDEATIKIRLANAKKEMALAESEGKYEYTIINDDLQTAKKEAESIVRSHI
jgi:guanylate kinase